MASTNVNTGTIGLIDAFARDPNYGLEQFYNDLTDNNGPYNLDGDEFFDVFPVESALKLLEGRISAIPLGDISMNVINNIRTIAGKLKSNQDGGTASKDSSKMQSAAMQLEKVASDRIARLQVELVAMRRQIDKPKKKKSRKPAPPKGSLAEKLSQAGGQMFEKAIRPVAFALLNKIAELDASEYREINDTSIFFGEGGELYLAPKKPKIVNVIGATVGKRPGENELYYMSRQVISGIADGGDIKAKKNDIWSLGMVLYRMAKGPFHIKVQTFFYSMGEGEKPPQLDPDKFNPALCDLVDQCLQHDPNARPSVAELLKHPFITSPDGE